jgi:hypothetical protein
MEEKQTLSVEEIEAQMIIELPDRSLMQAENFSEINAALQIIEVLLGLF